MHLKSAMFPARDLAWPYLAIETKGRQGRLDVAMLQNANNGAVMMNNMLQLKRALGKEHEFPGHIMVMSMELTTESISLSGQFTVKNAAGAFEYHSVCLHCASAWDPTGNGFKSSYQKAMNAVELCRKKTIKWVMEDMATLEEKLVKLMHQGLNQMTPPTSHLARSQLPRRSSTRGSSRGASLSSSIPRKKSTLSSQIEPLEANQPGDLDSEIEDARTGKASGNTDQS